MDSYSRPCCIIPAAGESRRFTELGHPNKAEITVNNWRLGKKRMIDHVIDSVDNAALRPIVVRKNLNNSTISNRLMGDDNIWIQYSSGQADTVFQGLGVLLESGAITHNDPVFVLNSDVVLLNPEKITMIASEAMALGYQATFSARRILNPKQFNPAMSYCYPPERPFIFQEKPEFWIPGAAALTGFYMFYNAGFLYSILEDILDLDENDEPYLSWVFYEYAYMATTHDIPVVDWGTPDLLDNDPNVLSWG